MLRALYIGLFVVLLVLPCAAQMHSFTAPQYAALRDTAAKAPLLRRALADERRASKFYWNQADSLKQENQELGVANNQLRRCLYTEIDRSHKLLAENERLRRLTQKAGKVPYYYTHPAR
jgi:hypothetical protein